MPSSNPGIPSRAAHDAPSEQEGYIACLSDLCSSLETQVGVVRRSIETNRSLPSHFLQNVESVTSRLIGSIETCKLDLRSSSNGCRNGPGATKSSWFSCAPDDRRLELQTICLPMLGSRRNMIGAFSGSSHGVNAVQPEADCMGGHGKDIMPTSPSACSMDQAPESVEEARVASKASESKTDGKRTPEESQASPELNLNDVNILLSTDPATSVSAASEGRAKDNSDPLVPAGMTEQVRRMSLTEQMVLDDAESNGDDAVSGKFVDGVMNPNWPGRLGWDIGVILLVLVDAMVLPFQMAYKDGQSPDTMDTVWMWLTTTFFMADMCASFFTAYTAGEKEPGIAPGKLVTAKHRIARTYLRTWFPIDFTSTIPWGVLADLVSGGGSANTAQMVKLVKIVKFVRFLRLMRMLRLAKLAMIWEKVEARMGSVILKQSIALLRVILILVGVCHWNACIWWMIGQPSSILTSLMTEEKQLAWASVPHWTTVKRGPPGSTWTWLDDHETGDQYIFCFYWTLGVMRTMPAEVQPVNKPERLYVMVFMFFAFSMFAICVSLITQTFFKFSERKRLFDDDMSQVRVYLRNLRGGGVSEKLQESVKGYLAHLFEQRRIHAKETQLLNALPAALQQQLKYERVGHHLLKLPLVDALPPKAAVYISQLCEILDVPTGSCLSRRGRRAEAAWIVMSGRLMMSRQDVACYSSEDTSVDAVDVVDTHCLVAEDATSNHTVHAVICSVCIKIDRGSFVQMVHATEDFWGSLKLNFGEAKVRTSEFGHVHVPIQSNETIGATAAIMCS